MKRKGLELSEEDRKKLLEIVKKGQGWRIWHRAPTLLYSGAGWQAKAIAKRQKLKLDAN